MLRSMNDLKDYTIQAIDGNIGHVKDFYFDDKTWVVRYLIVDTGNWLSSRKVLISPIAIGKPNWRQRELPVSSTKEQVKNSPDIDTAKPVSRQHEMQYIEYYNYPSYWGNVGLWSEEPFPNPMTTVAGDPLITPAILENANDQNDTGTAKLVECSQDDPHLRSCIVVTGYDIEATDGIIGHVCGFLVDEDTWAIRYLVVQTGNWWLGHRVLIAPSWITGVRWFDGKVSVNLARLTVKDAPEYDPTVKLNREKEIAIHRHYSHAGYWENQAEREEVLSPD
jgi:hypothetical protein